MCRVMADDSVTRVMKERMEDTWLPKILQYARKTEKPSVRKVLNEMEKSITLAQISEKGNVLMLTKFVDVYVNFIKLTLQ